jgi:hypothetical protein
VFDEATGRFAGLVGGEHAAVVLDSASVVVKPDVAARQIAEDQGPVEQPPVGEGASVGSPTSNGSAGDGRTPATTAPASPTRFYGRVSLEPVRMLLDLGEIADAIVAQLGRASADINIAVEIEATSNAGFSDDVRRTVSENARTLKFDTHEFESE